MPFIIIFIILFIIFYSFKIKNKPVPKILNAETINADIKEGKRTLYYSWEHQFWGDTINPTHGWKLGLKNGDIVVFQSKSGYIQAYEITDLQYSSDPCDMFFYKPKGVCFLQKNYLTCLNPFTDTYEEAMRSEELSEEKYVK